MRIRVNKPSNSIAYALSKGFTTRVGAKSALYEGYTLHELRHIQATLLQGVVSPKAAQYRLDHRQISMTMNTYAHFLDAEDIAVAEAMDSILKPKAK